jgi:hypothetical protein
MISLVCVGCGSDDVTLRVMSDMFPMAYVSADSSVESADNGFEGETLQELRDFIKSSLSKGKSVEVCGDCMGECEDETSLEAILSDGTSTKDHRKMLFELFSDASINISDIAGVKDY